MTTKNTTTLANPTLTGAEIAILNAAQAILNAHAAKVLEFQDAATSAGAYDASRDQTRRRESLQGAASTLWFVVSKESEAGRLEAIVPKKPAKKAPAKKPAKKATKKATPKAPRENADGTLYFGVLVACQRLTMFAVRKTGKAPKGLHLTLGAAKAETRRHFNDVGMTRRQRSDSKSTIKDWTKAEIIGGGETGVSVSCY